MNESIAATDWSVPLLVLAAVLGLVVGSFLNVVIYRVPAGESLLTPSHCPHCGKPIKWYQNIPVVSWLALRGRSRCCATPISVQYPLVEAFTALAWVSVTWIMVARFPISSARLVEGLTYLYLVSISIALAVIDARWRRLPDTIVVPSYVVIALGLTISSMLSGDFGSLGRAGLGMLVLGGFYLILMLLKPGGMGAGDVKLAGVLGLALGWLSWPQLFIGAFAGFLGGGIWGIALILSRRGTAKSAIPFGPFMLLGAWVAIFVSQPVLEGISRLYGLV